MKIFEKQERYEAPKEALIPEEVLNEEDQKYLLGMHNRAIRFYFYLQNGLDILNLFRNLFLGFIALYVALKLTNVLWVGAMLPPAIIILIVVGWYNVHVLSKMGEWLRIRFSTHYGLKSYNYQSTSTELLTEIRDLLKNLLKKIDSQNNK